jgi:chemotaxis signal transduction protein
MSAHARERPESRHRYLLLLTGEQLCALPLLAVRRVVRQLPVKPLPGAGEALLGLAEFAGEPLPVLDLGRLLGAPPGANPDLPVTVVAWAGSEPQRELVGLAADAALEVVELATADITVLPGGIVHGEVPVHGRAARVLDLVELGGAG